MLSNNESVGYYSSSLKFVKIIIAVLAAISSAMIPKMVQIFNQGNELQFNKMVQSSFELIIHIGIPISFLVCLMAPEIIQILFGVNYQRSILPLQITSPLIIIVSLSTIFGFQILSVHARDKYILKAAVSGMLVSLILSFLLIPRYHEIGASITILLTEIVVLSSFIYASFQLVQLSNTRKLIYNEIIALLPYLLIVFCARYFKIDSVILKVLLILSFSLIWFLVLHFILFSTSTIKIQFNQVLMRYIKK
jgi:O-antigen/teichoic acid export membrane protein